MERLSESLQKLLQQQIANEENSSRLYRAASQWLDFNGWFGAAKLFHEYANEEMIHVKKIYKYLQDRDILPMTPALPAQPTKFDGVKDIITKSYLHEIEVTKQIENIASTALSEKDLTTHQFMTFYLNEQIEEEAKTLYWVDRYDMLETSKSDMFFLDKEMKHFAKKY